MLPSLDMTSVRSPLWSQAASQGESLSQGSVRSEAEGEVRSREPESSRTSGTNQRSLS